MENSVKLIHETLAVGPTPINRKTSDNPIEILENYIETVTNDHDDQNVYEIDPVITWETLKNGLTQLLLREVCLSLIFFYQGKSRFE